MKKCTWDNANKMHFESLHKTFNMQCRCITTGNQIGDVVLSSYVRPYNEVECNGRVNPEGHLQEYDLGWLLKLLPSYVKDSIREIAKTVGVIAYHFFYREKGRRIDIGYVVTDRKYRLLHAWYCGSYKANNALDEAIKYITE